MRNKLGILVVSDHIFHINQSWDLYINIPKEKHFIYTKILAGSCEKINMSKVPFEISDIGSEKDRKVCIIIVLHYQHRLWFCV